MYKIYFTLGKRRGTKPCRPAPPPPSGSRPTVSQPSTAAQVPNRPEEIQTTPLPQSHPSVLNSSTVETLPFSEALQADALSSITSPKASITQTSQGTNTNIQVTCVKEKMTFSDINNPKTQVLMFYSSCYITQGK